MTKRRRNPDVLVDPSTGMSSPSLKTRIDLHFAKLATIGNEPDGSISRIAYSDAECAAMAYIRSEGEAFGLVGHYDPVGNLVLSTDPTAKTRLLIGSHLDSVPRGGNYDGAAGIVAGLEAMRMLLSDGDRLDFAVDLVAWRGEEYTFNAVYKGSTAAFGVAEPHILHNCYNDQSLRDAILLQGFDPSYLDEGRPALEPDYVDSIDAYVELHIEQGVQLEQARKDIGIVTSIAGDRRFLVVLEGRFDHSGATPMGRRHRRDVNLAMAYIHVRLDALAEKHRERGMTFVQTVGIVNADPEIDKKYPDVHSNSVTKVSGLGYFTLDIMSSDDDFMDAYSAEVQRVIWQTAKEFGVTAVIEQTDWANGLRTLDETMTALLCQAADDEGVSWMRLGSGAGHDTVAVALARKSSGEAIPTAMVFVPCKAGVSHAKEEYTDHKHIAQGAHVLYRSLRRHGASDVNAARHG